MASSVYSLSMSAKRKRDFSEGGMTQHNRNGHAPMEIELAESKKSRLDHVATSPSKVIHVRNMPTDATEQELALFAIPFGLIKSMVMSKKNSQALIELVDLSEAIELVAYYEEYPASLHGRTLVLQFSTHSHLELSSESTAIDNAIRNANRIVEQDLSGVNSGLPNTVLRIVIDNIMGQQINHLILYKIFHRFGKILRVILFLRTNQYHCLLEFQNHTAAFVAMLNLNGQNIYTGCCSLRVEFSKNRGPLEVRRESDKCRDYLLSPLTDEEVLGLQDQPSGFGTNLGVMNQGTSTLPGQLSLTNTSVLSQSVGGGTGLYSAVQNQSVTSGINDLATQLTLLAQQSGLALTPAAAAATASFMALTAHGTGQMSTAALGNPPPVLSLAGQPQTLTTNFGLAVSGSTVLMVSNLDEEKVKPDALFTLFGVYGDVTRVKIMFNKKNTALVQFTDANQATIALQHLNGKPLWGKPLKISLSRYNVVQIPKEDTDVGLTKDYTMSPLHRFRKPNSKNFQNIYAPSHVLHLSNIPPTAGEETIRALFESKGFDVLGFRFMQKDNRMALIELGSVDLAVQALIELHNTQLSENSHLRISFSKSAI